MLEGDGCVKMIDSVEFVESELLVEGRGESFINSPLLVKAF